MALFKCKMCGGSLEIIVGTTVIECEYCGTQQTLPNLDDDRRANLYDRANHFRRNNEFDKAMGIYENILNEDNSDAEAYWSIVLCRYGIEYVEDPVSHKRIPTVNRAQFTSVFDDDNYKSAIKYADASQRSVYEAEAKAINEIQKNILAISQKEEPFDIFICYKESDANGRRTPDSVLANDLYHQLIQEGFKVFFSRITLEDKLGSAYEPYIFAALNSAKVMVVLGTKAEYFNSVWVKNEWSRYLALIKQGQKKMLIPAYKDMDPYDLPDEFSHLQAQDMSKLGFMQDLIRGIKKITQSEAPQVTVVKETVVSTVPSTIAPLIKRIFMFLEDSKWTEADEYCEKVLDMDPECADAYLGKLMAELRVNIKESLKNCENPFDDRGDFAKIMRFGDDALIDELNHYNIIIRERNEENRKARIYNTADALAKQNIPEKLHEAANEFEKIVGYRDAEIRAKECREQAEENRKASIYNTADALVKQNNPLKLREAAHEFEKIIGYRDAEARAKGCREQAEKNRKARIYNTADALVNQNTPEKLREAAHEFEKIIGYRDAEARAKECRQKALMMLYDQAVDAMEKAISPEQYKAAAEMFSDIANDFELAKEKADECRECAENVRKDSIYFDAIRRTKCNNVVQLEIAIEEFETIIDWKDSEAKIEECKAKIEEIKAEDIKRKQLEEIAKQKYAKKAKLKNIIILCALLVLLGCIIFLGIYVNVIVPNNNYQNALSLMDNGNIVEAYDAFIELDDYKDSLDKAESIYEQYEIAKMGEAQVGDSVFFGKYEQDNYSDGMEEIEWLVLDVKDDRILVISKKALDHELFHFIYRTVTWETCRLRKWLNDDFINSAFSEYQKSQIPIVTVPADPNPESSVDPGNDTQDQIFLLSITEVNEYFDFDIERACELTNSAWNVCQNKSWWLRTPGNTVRRTTYVNEDGTINYDGTTVNTEHIAVRPAMWIDVTP